jgi:hypothetical protein
MAGGEPFIKMTLSVDQPIELGDFVTAFTALGAEYDRYSRDAGKDDHATLYVSDVQQGSIIAILVPVLLGLAIIGDAAGRAIALDEFVRRYGNRLLTYLGAGGRLPDATKAELKDFSEQVAAISHNPGSTLEIAAIEIVNGNQSVRAAFKFDTAQARTISDNVEIHRHEIENASGDNHERVLMTFTRSDVRTTAVGKRSGEQVRIETISDRSVPIIYASELAERAIKYEITEAEDNVYKKGFVVDVNLELRQGRLAAYRITNLHQVIDLPDDP